MGAKQLDIKICGLSGADGVNAALAGGATHVGFIFFAPSPRNVSPHQAGELAMLAQGRALSVAVTVDAADAEIDAIVAQMKPDWLQLHGGESPARLRQLKARYRIPVMKALAIREAGDLAAIRPYVGVADRFLFDAKPPKGAELPGGNGVSFDWKLLAGLDRGIDYMLSGGVNTANVGEAILSTRGSGVDISSGVESAPGVKDVRRIGEFLAAAKQAELDKQAQQDRAAALSGAQA